MSSDDYVGLTFAALIVGWLLLCRFVIEPRMNRTFEAEMEAAKDPNSRHYWRRQVARSMHAQGFDQRDINHFMYRGTPEYQAEHDAREERLRRRLPEMYKHHPKEQANDPEGS